MHFVHGIHVHAQILRELTTLDCIAPKLCTAVHRRQPYSHVCTSCTAPLPAHNTCCKTCNRKLRAAADQLVSTCTFTIVLAKGEDHLFLLTAAYKLLTCLGSVCSAGRHCNRRHDSDLLLLRRRRPCRTMAGQRDIFTSSVPVCGTQIVSSFWIIREMPLPPLHEH